MMRSVSQGLADADLIFHFIDFSIPSGAGDRYVKQFISERKIPVILVLNKIDLVNRNKGIAKMDKLYQEFQPLEMVPISALNGENIQNLLKVGAAYLPEAASLFPDDELTDQPLRFMVQEFIREKLLHFTRDEIPHAIAVTIEHWEEREDGYSIGAVVYVEKDTQRRIVLGAGGQMIRKITQGSRRSLKKLLEKPVELELFVKVRQKWRDTDALFPELRLTGD